MPVTPVEVPPMTVGLGGVFAEALRDVARCPIPVSRCDAHRMLRELRGYAILSGDVGGNPRDIDAVVEAMLSVSALGNAARWWAPEIDVNPLIVGPPGHGAVAVDAVVLHGK